MYGVEGRMTMLTNSDAAYLTSHSAASAAAVRPDVPNTSNSSDTPAATVATSKQTQLLSMEQLKPTTTSNAKPHSLNNNLDVSITIANEINPLASSVFAPSITQPNQSGECDQSDTLRRFYLFIILYCIKNMFIFVLTQVAKISELMRL